MKNCEKTTFKNGLCEFQYIQPTFLYSVGSHKHTHFLIKPQYINNKNNIN